MKTTGGSFGFAKHRQACGPRRKGGNARPCAEWFNREAATARRLRDDRKVMYGSVHECFSKEGRRR